MPHVELCFHLNLFSTSIGGEVAEARVNSLNDRLTIHALPSRPENSVALVQCALCVYKRESEKESERVCVCIILTSCFKIKKKIGAVI